MNRIIRDIWLLLKLKIIWPLLRVIPLLLLRIAFLPLVTVVTIMYFPFRQKFLKMVYCYLDRPYFIIKGFVFLLRYYYQLICQQVWLARSNSRIAAPIRITGETRKKLDEIREQGKGIVFFSGHFLTGRLLQRWLNELQLEPYFISLHQTGEVKRIRDEAGVKSAEQKNLAYIYSMQEKMFADRVTGVDTSIKRVYRHLKNNGSLLIYQDVIGLSENQVNFLGMKTNLASGAIKIARNTGSYLVPVVIKPGSVLTNPELILGIPVDTQADYMDAEILMFGALETFIKQYPYCWGYWNWFIDSVETAVTV